MLTCSLRATHLAPACGWRHEAPTLRPRLPAGSCGPVNPLRRATPQVHRQHQSGAMRLQPIAARPQPIPASVLEEMNKPSGVARAKTLRGSPHKARRVLDLIRGKTYEEALVLLEYLPFRACEQILVVLLSAADNAKNNAGLRKSRLYVSECTADGAESMKRWTFAAKGKANLMRKPSYHLKIKVSERA